MLSKDKRELYEVCWSCHGTRKTRIAFNAGRLDELPVGSPCELCEDGYVTTGMTIGQLRKSATVGKRLRAIDKAAIDLVQALQTGTLTLEIHQLVALDKLKLTLEELRAEEANRAEPTAT